MAGPDWTMLFVGSEGTLGLVTKIMVRLVDKPETEQTLLAQFDKIDDAARTVQYLNGIRHHSNDFGDYGSNDHFGSRKPLKDWLACGGGGCTAIN